MRRAAALLALSVYACAPGPEAAAPAYISLDCAQPFEALKARVIAQDVVPAPEDPAEPYSYYSSPDGRTSYLITQPGAPGHPAIMMQRAKGGEVITAGCPYGDKAGYEQLHAYLDGLKHWRRK